MIQSIFSPHFRQSFNWRGVKSWASSTSITLAFPGGGISPEGAFCNRMAGRIRKTHYTQNGFPGRTDWKSTKAGYKKEIKKGTVLNNQPVPFQNILVFQLLFYVFLLNFIYHSREPGYRNLRQLPSLFQHHSPRQLLLQPPPHSQEPVLPLLPGC